ncbi:MAG: hypothetical protein NTY38_24795 [Acidobacteria bacterium]|nr:hypothetical protein [Acidobacteriota bacterium]
MKIRYFRLAAGLLCLAGTALPGGAGASSKVTGAWQIRTPASCPSAVTRAARDLQSFLRERHGIELPISQQARRLEIVLGTSAEAAENGFRVWAAPDALSITVEGRTPLAIYQGVFLLEDQFRDSATLAGGFEKRVVYPFKERYVLWDALLTGQNKEAIGFDLERHVREAVRLGYTGMECNRFVGMTLPQQNHPRDPYPWYTYWGPSMDQFVSSPLFEGVFEKAYLARNLADLKHVVDVVSSFGLKPIFMGYEPRYVPDAFLARHPELRGPRVDHPLRSMQPRYSLCTDRPEVREHYRALAQRLSEEVPLLAEMHMIFLDSGAGFCWEHGLYAGRNGPEFCRNIPAGERMSKFLMAIRQGFRDAGHNIQLVSQPHGGSRGEFDQFFDTVPKEIEFTSGQWASWSLTFQDPLEVDRHVMDRQRETGRRVLYYQQHFFGFDGAPTTEFPVPYHLAERLHRALGLKLDGLNTLGGFVSPPVKARSAMQEVYREFLLTPEKPANELVEQVARELGGPEGGALLATAWKGIQAAVQQNRHNIGFAMGTEFTSRRTLVRPLVPDTPALLPAERDWWQAYTFAGDLRFGHAHLFRNEGGPPAQAWYTTNRTQSVRAAAAMRQGSAALQAFLKDHPEAAGKWPYLVSHERQLRFLSHVYTTGANLYEGQRILDRYSAKAIEDDLKSEVEADIASFERIVASEIDNTRALLRLIAEGGELGMVLLPQETTWGYSTNLADLLQRKIDVMQRHVPETREVLKRWFGSY